MYTRWSPELKDWLNRPGTQILQLGDLDYHVTAGPHQKALLSIAPDIDNIIESGNIQKRSKKSTAALCSVDGVEFFAKHVRFTEKKFLFRLRYFVSPSRSYWTAVVADHLERAGLHTPKVLAAGDRRQIGLVSDSYIVTEVLHGADTANEALRSQPNSTKLLKDAGTLLKRLHDSGMAHGDIKLANFYVSGNDMGFWDLDSAMLFSNGTPEKWRIRDLGRLLSSFIITVDSMPKTSEEFFDVKSFAQTLGQSYGIDASRILSHFESYWLKKMKIQHTIKL